MKKVTMLLTLCTVFCGSAFADDCCPKPQPPAPKTCGPSCQFAWGTAITALTVLGVVVGLTASQATGNSNHH